jgi:hypothetical protein
MTVPFAGLRLLSVVHSEIMEIDKQGCYIVNRTVHRGPANITTPALSFRVEWHAPHPPIDQILLL